jgi:hypothetical protein
LQNFISELRVLGLKPRVSILQTCSAEQWQNWERFWIATVEAAGAKLLNLHPGGDGPVEARAWNKGKKLSPEQRSKLNLSGLLNQSTESRRLNRLGKKDSEETRLKKSLAAKGKKFSSEHIEKVRKIHLGRKRSAITKERLAISHTGLKQSPETIAKRLEKMEKIRQTPEYREKVSAGLRESWRRRRES